MEYRKAADLAKAIYPKYAELDTDRQAKLVRPLALGLLDGETKKAAQTRLVKAVESFHYRVGTGFLSTPFLLGELTEAGATETAYQVLLNPEKPGWLYEVLQGATTVWETWEGYVGKGDAGSLNHYSPGAVCQWLFDTCAGIRVEGGESLRYRAHSRRRVEPCRGQLQEPLRRGKKRLGEDGKRCEVHSYDPTQLHSRDSFAEWLYRNRDCGHLSILSKFEKGEEK